MQDNARAGAFALIGGTATYLLVVALHPTHGTGATFHGISVGELVHAAAVLAGPLFLFGFLVLAQRQGLERWPVQLAAVFYGLGSAVGLLAPAISGMVAPKVFKAADEGASAELVHAMGDLAFWLNQAAFSVQTTLVSVAVLLVCAAWRGRGTMDAAVRWWGQLAAAGVLAWQVFGSGRVDVHALGAIVLAIGGWHVLVAAWLLRDRTPAEAATPPA